MRMKNCLLISIISILFTTPVLANDNMENVFDCRLNATGSTGHKIERTFKYSIDEHEPNGLTIKDGQGFGVIFYISRSNESLYASVTGAPYYNSVTGMTDSTSQSIFASGDSNSRGTTIFCESYSWTKFCDENNVSSGVSIAKRSLRDSPGGKTTGFITQKNQAVEIMDEAKPWVKINSSGTIGWVSSVSIKRCSN